MAEEACFLDDHQRVLVEQAIRDHCRIRKWELLAVNCRTNHVHVVVAANRDPQDVRDQLKAWCTRKLKQLATTHGVGVRTRWWTEKGSQRYIGDEKSLEAVIRYVKECQ